MKQTAVGLLIQNIVEDQTIKAKSMSEWIMVFEKVKEMEKEQIIDFTRKAVRKILDEDRQNPFNLEQYYNETFKSE
jgi:hypothetical protein